MSNNKNIDLQHYADMFKALSNTNRLKIFMKLISCCAPGTVCRLEDEGAVCVGDLGRDLKIAPSTVSHHLKELRQSGLVNMERRGQNIDCWINPGVLDELAAFFIKDAKLLSICGFEDE